MPLHYSGLDSKDVPVSTRAGIVCAEALTLVGDVKVHAQRSLLSH